MIPEVKDRNVEFPNRYRLVKTETGEDVGVYDLVEETGEVYEEGTVVDAELLNKYKDYAERAEAVDIEFFKRLKEAEDKADDTNERLTQETERAIAAEKQEKSERESEITRVEGLITAEETRATTQEGELDAKIDAQNTALTGEITRIDGELEAEVSARESEISRVEKDISNLQSDVDADLQAQDVLLRAEIAKVEKKADDETSKRSSEITRVDGRIDTLESDVNDKYVELEGKIVTETARAKAVEGELNNLTTTARGSLVNAINEVNAEADANRAAAGDLSGLATEETDTLVGAINEVHDELDEEVRRAATTHEDFEGRIAAIESKVPTAATADNKLVDRDTMNSTLVSSAAFFRGTYETKAALDEWQTLNPTTATNNDYAYVQDDETHNHEAWRYIYVASAGAWQAQFKVNNAPLNADQVKALNSGVTTEKVAEISTKVAQKTDANTLYGVDNLGTQVMVPQANFATAVQGRTADTAAKNIGDLETLTTVSKETLVAAINEVAAGATGESGAVGAKLDAEIAAREKAEKELDAKIGAVRGMFRFSDSAVSSTFAGESTELLKSDLIGDGTPRVGDSVIFPDDKTLVLYIGRITAVNGDSYTVGNIGYINNVWQPSGSPWVSGIIASYPEVYNYNGGTWLCLGSDVQTAPVKGEEWFEISKPIPVVSETENGLMSPEMYTKLEAQFTLTDANTLRTNKTLIIDPPGIGWAEGIRLNAANNGVANFFFAGPYGSTREANSFVMGTGTARDRLCFGYSHSVNNANSRVEIRKDGTLYENNARVYSANNEPPYPVTSVNGKTGDVNVTVNDLKLTDRQTAALNFTPILIPNGTDFNNLKTPGYYVVRSDSSARTMSNIPEKRAAYVIVLADNADGAPYVAFSQIFIDVDSEPQAESDANRVVQIYSRYYYNGNLPERAHKTYRRKFFANTTPQWEDWQEDYNSANPPPIVTDEQINSLFEE